MIATASKARSNLYRLIDEVVQTNEPLVVTGKRGNVVMLSEEDYRGIEETLYLCSIPGMRESLFEAAHEPLEEYTPESEVSW